VEKTVKGVKGIVMQNDKCLVLAERSGQLDLPGGRVEKGEGIRAALSREVAEETGLNVEVLSPIGEWSLRKDGKPLIRGVTFFCSLTDGDLKLSGEHVGYSWIDIARLSQKDLKHPYAVDSANLSSLAGAFQDSAQARAA
jgi:8-oxo-dGTP diphosphatase